MSAQGSIYVSTARNARHLSRAMIGSLVEMETDPESDVIMRKCEDHSIDMLIASNEIPLHDECYDYTKLVVGIDRSGIYSHFKISQSAIEMEEYIRHDDYIPYDPWDDYVHELDSIYDMY